MNNPNAQKEEQLGRRIFQQLADQKDWKVDFTKEQFNPIDLHLALKCSDGVTRTCSGEIKNRSTSALKYKTHIITIHKLKALIKDKKSQCAIFINIFGDDIFIYDYKKLVRLILNKQITPYYKRLPNFNVAGTDYHWEKVIEVNRDNAIHYKKIENKWIKINK